MPESEFEDRVRRAAEACLKRDGSVGPLELFQEMRLLEPVHFREWQKGNPHYAVLEQHIQCGRAKLEKCSSSSACNARPLPHP